jgi:threonine/homoserine/homoserine lactone efflux protein
LKEGHAEPDALKWVERPSIPSDAAKQLEMMKFFPGEATKSPRSKPILLGVGAVSLVAFAVIFGLLYLILRRSAPSFGAFVLVLGTGFLAYLGWVFLRAYRRGPR